MIVVNLSFWLFRSRFKRWGGPYHYFAVMGYAKKSFVIDSPWIKDQATITTYHIEELLGTKLRALFQRKKGRDLFDLGVALELLDLNLDQLIECFNKYVDFKVTKSQFEQNLYLKLQEPSFIAEVASLMPVNSQFTKKMNRYAHNVYEKIITKLSGDSWKGGFSID